MTKRKWFVLVLTVFLVLGFVVSVSASDKCTTIQDGTLVYSAGHYLAGEPLTVGYDIFGYNYQARMFKGSYANSFLGGAGSPPYEGEDAMLLMKWNDAWLSNKDCDGDGLLDRHSGYDSYIGSGAWLTNHIWGGQGKDSWTYFFKIVAVPEDAVLVGNTWYTADGVEIGPVIWGEFAIVQAMFIGEQNYNYVSPSGPGLGKW